MEDGELPPEPPRVSTSESQPPNTHEPREERAGQSVRHLSSGHAAMGARADSYADHLAMLDERQQNRARKLERETEEVDGRWRTIQSASSPTRSPHSRRSDPDHGLTIDSYRPNGLYRANEHDTYRPDRSSVPAHGSTHPVRLYGMPKPAPQPMISVPLGPSNKRKLEAGSARVEYSNKSSGNPSQSARCGKRMCNNIAMSGKDRCQPCYTAEGRRRGVSLPHLGSFVIQRTKNFEPKTVADTLQDERRRCASTTCTHVISDASKEDLCKKCLEEESRGTKLRLGLCNRPLCNNDLQPGKPDPDLLFRSALAYHRLEEEVRLTFPRCSRIVMFGLFPSVDTWPILQTPWLWRYAFDE